MTIVCPFKNLYEYAIVLKPVQKKCSTTYFTSPRGIKRPNGAKKIILG
jgi:hypothetical protein